MVQMKETSALTSQIPLINFISHMVQMKAKDKAAQKLVDVLYIPHGSDERCSTN